MKSIVIIGSGGHANSIIDLVEDTRDWSISAIVGIERELGKKILNYKVEYKDENIDELYKISKYAVLAIGQLPKPDLRKKILSKYINKGFLFPKIISRNSYVSKSCTIGEGTTIGHGAIINANARIGSFSIINSKSLIEHDANIGDFCHISTGAIVNGHTKIGKECFLGSSSMIRENIIINSNSIISAGKIIMKSI